MELRLPATPLMAVFAMAFIVLNSSNAAEVGKSTNEKQPLLTTNSVSSATVTAPAENKCLNCHGPFVKLIVSTTNYVAASGEKISPHRYVPHDSKLQKDVPDCLHCHTAQSLTFLPAKGSIDLKKANVEWCYSCHHEKNFQSCKDCHP